jgi:predicted nucleic acid-binding protein
MEAVADFQAKIQPLLETIWVDSEWHARGMQRLFAGWKKDVSLVDCLSFEIMETRDLQTAIAFDRHFEENGFTLAAFHDLDARG